MHSKDAEGMANSLDPDQIAQSGLIWVYNVCPDLSVRKLRVITVGRVRQSTVEPCCNYRNICVPLHTIICEAKMQTFSLQFVY